MSFTDDFLKGLKKRKYQKEEEEDIAPFSPERIIKNAARNTAVAGLGRVKWDGEEEDKWFQKGASDTDISKAILGTLADVGEDFTTGIVGMGENVVDAMAWLAPIASKSQYIANGGGLGFNQEADRLFEEQHEASKKEMSKFIAKDLYDENKVAKQLLSNLYSGANNINKLQSGMHLTEDELLAQQQGAQYALNYMDNEMENDSVLAKKSDSLVQSGGQLVGTAALTAMGIPSEIVIGLTSFGSEAENALKQGATYEEAGLSATISAGAEILSEKISGGIKFGGKTADEFATKWLARNISNKAVRTGLKLGMDMLGEGGEEILSGYMGAIGQKLTYMSEKEMSELFSSEDAWESFIGGAVLGGVGSVTQAAKGKITGVDAVTELTDNEQKVVDRLYEDAIAEAKKNGKVTQKMKSEIYDEILNDLEKGYINTDTIEEVLGGDSYKSYKDAVDSENALTEQEKKLDDEFKDLNKMVWQEMTGEQHDRREELRDQLKDLRAKINDPQSKANKELLKAQLNKNVYEMSKGDRLVESYFEQVRSKQKFNADLSKYEGRARDVIKKVMDSKLADNSNQTHEFWDWAAKMATDLDTDITLATNEQLLEMLKAEHEADGKEFDESQFEGQTIDGYASKNGIVLNAKSKRALNFIVGHEVTHKLEKTKHYGKLQKLLFEYAKDEYESRFQKRSGQYSNKFAADEKYKSNVDKEVTSDLVGDYLFTDKGFIDHLTKDMNVFQKVWNEIKYMAKIATAGSEQAKQLEKVKREFERAYREANKKAQSGVQYSLSPVEAVQPKSDKWSRTHTTEEAMARFPNMWNVAAEESEVRNPTQITSTVNSYRKIYNFLQNEGFNGTILDASSGLGYGTKAGVEEYGFNVEDIEPYPDKGYNPKYQDYSTLDKKYDVIISNAVLNVLPQDQRDALAVKMGEMLNEGGRLFVNVRGKDVESLAKTGKNIHLGNMEWIETVKGSYQKGFTKPELVAYLQDALGDGFTVKPTNMFGAVSAVVTKNGTAKYSLSDSEGNQLSKEQQEFFKDSKAVDRNGNLLKVYHTTSNDFTVFDKARKGEATQDGNTYMGFFFADDAEYMQNFPEFQNGKTEAYYLNMKNPIDMTDISKEAFLDIVEVMGGDVDEAADLFDEELTAEQQRARNRGDNNTSLQLGHLLDALTGEFYYNDFVNELKPHYDELMSKGYDGVVGYLDELWGAKEYIVLDSNQAKLTTNTKPTGDPDIRFSVSDAVEETKDLMALHNLTEQKLLKSLRLGGLPMPSVAIAKAKDGHGEFGEISLILPKEAIDPKSSRNNKLYSGDAWTPTYPSVDYKVDEKVLRNISKKLYGLAPSDVLRDLGRISLDADNMGDTLNSYGGDIIEAFKDNDALKYAYLLDNGADITLPMKEKRISYGSRENGEIIRVAEAIPADVIKQALNGASAEMRKLEPMVRQAVAEYWQENYGDDPDALELLIPKEELSFSELDGYLSDAMRYHRNGVERTVDRRAARTAIADQTIQTEYEKWLEQTFSGIVEKEGIRNNKDYFTPSGNRRSFEALHYEHNLENVIKAMREKGEKGIGNGFGGASIFGASTTEFSSIEEMKQSSDRLHTMSYDEYQELRKGFTDRFLEIALSLPNEKNSFMATDSAAEVLTEAVAKYKTRSGIANYLKRELSGWATYSEQAVDDLIELVNDIRQMPTGYFEAKPQRAVGFDEVGVFVIPRNADVKLKQELLNRGYSIAEYDPDVEGDRQKVVNQFEEYKFSLSDVGEQHKQYGRYNVYAKDMLLNKGDIAPVAENAAGETVSTAENVPVVADDEELFPDDLAPAQDLEQLMAEEAEMRGVLEAYAGVGDIDAVNRLLPEYEEIRDRIRELEADEADRFGSLDDADAPPEVEAPYYESEPVSVDNPFADRDMHDVGNRKVKAYMYENPEVKPFFQDAALGMLSDLRDGTKGERWYNGDVYYRTNGEKGFFGTKRNTTDDIAELLDQWHYTYDQIEKGLNAIIEDNGAENNAVSKRIEFMLNDRLLNGYKGVDGRPYPPDQDYINLLNEKQITEYSEEAFDSFIATADQYAPPMGDDIAPVQTVAPTETVNTGSMKGVIKGQETYITTEDKLKNRHPQPGVDATNSGQTSEVKTSKGGEVKGQQAMYQEAIRNESSKTANILTEEPKVERKKRSAWSMVKEKVLDKGMVFENLAKKTKNRELEARWNSIHYAEGKAQRLMGEGAIGVKSLNEIREKVEGTRKTKEFYEYLYHKHNIDRMTLEDRYENTPNKSVFGDAVTAEVSQGIVDQYEKDYPAFKKFAQDVYNYMNHLRKLMVDNGVISKETAKLWSEMYPHYVPIRRAGDTGLNINVPLDTGRTGVNAPIKRATGGNRDILPLFDTMGQRTIQTYKAIAKNRFGVELKNTLGTTIAKEATNVDEAIDSVDKHEGLLQEGKNGMNPTFTVFEDGKKVTFEITEEMYDSMKPTSDLLAYTNKVANTVSNIRKGMITEYNPWFLLKNAVKDVQDVLINSQHAAKTYAAIPKAFKEMATKGYWYTEYMENGGEDNTYFDNETNTFTQENKALETAKTVLGLNAISKANNVVEMLPRLAEYIASRESGRSVDVSMLDAARVTTNFAAGGDVTKFLNRNGATFLNASVQGAMQQARNIREAKQNGLKGVGVLAAKYLAAGLPALLLNHLLWDDDEEYAELSDYVKQNYYIVGKYGDGKFVRIPKGRMVSVIQEGFQQMENLITGDDEVDLGTFAELLVSNLAPNNPIENNILSPIIQVANNETWYGEDLVPTRLQDLPAAEQYDESTDSVSRWLGETFNVSPYKVNYLLDQYSGVVGDTFLPMLTPEAESGNDSVIGNMIAPLKDMFTTDSAMKNQNVTDFYDLMDELAVMANGSAATDEDILSSKYMSSVNAEISDLYKQKREIQNSDKSNAEKYAMVRDIQQQIVDLMKEGMSNYQNVSFEDDYRGGGEYARVGDRVYKWYVPGEDSDAEPGWQKLSDEQQTKYEVTKAAGDASYATDGTNHYRWYVPGEDAKDDAVPCWKKITDDQLEKQDEVTSGLGISPEDYWGNKEEYDFAYEYPAKYGVAKAVGGYKSYKTYSSELYDIKADKDSSGKSISGSRKAKVLDYINNLDADYYTKIILFKNEYNADDTYNYEIIEYLNSRSDISYSEMETILKELGFNVDSQGNITWD